MQILCCRDIQVQQTGEGQVHGSDFVKIDALVDAAQIFKIGFPKGHRGRRTKVGPLLSIKIDVAFAHGSTRYGLNEVFSDLGRPKPIRAYGETQLCRHQ